MIDFTITEEEQLLADTARRFGDEHLREPERDHEKAQAYPTELHKLFSEMGLSCSSVHLMAASMSGTRVTRKLVTFFFQREPPLFPSYFGNSLFSLDSKGLE